MIRLADFKSGIHSGFAGNVLTAGVAAARLGSERLQRDKKSAEVAVAETLPLKEYMREAWSIMRPATTFIPNWHIDAICDHLEAVTKGEIRNLLINIPPRHQKSLTVSVFWPTWVWTFMPAFRWVFASYAQQLSTRDSVESRRLIESGWYQAKWGNVFGLSSDQNQKMRYENDKSGHRIATSVGGSATGEGGDATVVDDPHNVKEKDSELARQEVLDWNDQVWSSRLDDPQTGRRVVIMQRVHEQDLSGHLLSKGGYVHLCLPSEYEPDRKCVTSIGWEDPRTEPGELLNKNRFGPDEIAAAKRDLGSRDYAGQHQQRPSSLEGGIFKRKWWKFWHHPDRPLPAVTVRTPDGELLNCPCEPLPASFDEVLQSWDMTFKDTKASDMVAGQIWAKQQANRYMLDAVADRMDFTKTIAAVRTMTLKWPQARIKLVEDKANGPAVISALKTSIAGFIPVEPYGGKIARANASTPEIESGNVYLPHPQMATWVLKFIDRCAAFPACDYDDEIDSMTQALIRFANRVSWRMV